MFGFPVPVSNQSIPRGWFAALVRFMNSLLLRGDGRYFAVTHTTEGTTIKPTPALIQALERSGGAAPAAGGGVQPAVLGFPDYMSAVSITYPTVAKKTTQNVWIAGDVLINHLGSGSGGSVYFALSTEPNSGGIWSANIAYFFTSDIEYYTSFIIPVPAGIYYKFSINGSATLTADEIPCIS